MFSRRNFLSLTAMSAAGLTLTPQNVLALSDKNTTILRASQLEQKLQGKKSAPSQLWGYNDSVPGPIIRTKQGKVTNIQLINDLEEPTSIHWHGLRIDNTMDGVSGLTQKAVAPGKTFNYSFIPPDPGTYWYHAHHKSWNQVARGLYGALIVEEHKPITDKKHDLVLMIDDWKLDREGRLDTESIGQFSEWSHGGRLGNSMTVNGVNKPILDLNEGEQYRLRLINSCNARILWLDLNVFGGRILSLDGQPVDATRLVSSKPYEFGPGQRIDILITPKKVGTFDFKEVSSKRPYVFIQFNVKANDIASTEESFPILSSNLKTPDLKNAQEYELIMQGGAMGRLDKVIYEGKNLSRDAMITNRQLWTFNSVANLDKLPMFRVAKGQTVKQTIINQTAFPHSMHLHGHHFKIISRSTSSGEVNVWRDTFLIGRNETVEIAFVADNPGKWLYHCHMLEHAAAGMNNWIEVT